MDYNELYQKYYAQEPEGMTDYEECKRKLAFKGFDSLYDFLGVTQGKFRHDGLRQLASEKEKPLQGKHDKKSAEVRELCGLCERHFITKEKREEYDKCLEFEKCKAILDDAKRIANLSEGRLSGERCTKYIDLLVDLLANPILAEEILISVCNANGFAFSIDSQKDIDKRNKQKADTLKSIDITKKKILVVKNEADKQDGILSEAQVLVGQYVQDAANVSKSAIISTQAALRAFYESNSDYSNEDKRVLEEKINLCIEEVNTAIANTDTAKQAVEKAVKSGKEYILEINSTIADMNRSFILLLELIKDDFETPDFETTLKAVQEKEKFAKEKLDLAWNINSDVVQSELNKARCYLRDTECHSNHMQYIMNEESQKAKARKQQEEAKWIQAIKAEEEKRIQEIRRIQAEADEVKWKKQERAKKTEEAKRIQEINAEEEKRVQAEKEKARQEQRAIEHHKWIIEQAKKRVKTTKIISFILLLLFLISIFISMAIMSALGSWPILLVVGIVMFLLGLINLHYENDLSYYSPHNNDNVVSFGKALMVLSGMVILLALLILVISRDSCLSSLY
ncbi:MAG: hypothetical protein FWF10_04560 [Clostridiales bacterium]|nr:hypothetical protein [Clostridiales bacterium]